MRKKKSPSSDDQPWLSIFIDSRSLVVLLLPLSIYLTGCGSGDEAPGDDTVEVFGVLGRQPGQFSLPRAVGVTAKEEIVAIDRTGRVQFVDVETGEFLRQWRLPAWKNGTPTGMTIDPVDDSIWIADTHYFRVLRYNAEGELLKMFGKEGEEDGEFFFITDVAPDPNGETVWCTDYGRANRIMQYSYDGEFISGFGTEPYVTDELERPMAIAISADGAELFVADAGNHRINVYTREGELLRRIGSPGNEPGQLNFPYDIAVDIEDTLYIAEYGNNRLSRFDKQGNFLGTWSGPGTTPGKLASPWGCTIAPDGSLIIADTLNHRLQVLRDPERYFRTSTVNGIASNSGGATRP